MFTLFMILPTLCSATPVDALPTSAAVESPAPFASLFTAQPVIAEPVRYEPALGMDDGNHSSPWYLRVNAGAVTTTSSDGPDGEDVDFDEGWLAAVAIGQRLTSGADPMNFALELEGVWTQQDADNDSDAIDDITTAAAYLNGVFDFRLAERLSLYAGAGIGAAWMDVGTNGDSLHDFNDEDGPFLSWQLKAGLIWHVSPGLGLSLGYRFRNIDDNEIDNDVDNSSFDLQTEQHIAEVGVQFGW